jgi:hypothetical protein
VAFLLDLVRRDTLEVTLAVQHAGGDLREVMVAHRHARL